MSYIASGHCLFFGRSHHDVDCLSGSQCFRIYIRREICGEDFSSLYNLYGCPCTGSNNATFFSILGAFNLSLRWISLWRRCRHPCLTTQSPEPSTAALVRSTAVVPGSYPALSKTWPACKLLWLPHLFPIRHSRWYNPETTIWSSSYMSVCTEPVSWLIYPYPSDLFSPVNGRHQGC